MYAEDESRSTGGFVGVVNHFHFFFREVIHGSDSGEQVETEFVADGCGNFYEFVFFNDEAGVAGAGVSGDKARETCNQVNSLG